MKNFKLRRSGFIVAILLIVVSSINMNESNAQANETGFILSMTEFTVKPGHNTQFREGVKTWKANYLEKGGTWTWNIWSRMQGEGNVYILTSRMDKWAEMDEIDEVAMKVRDLVRDLINPTIESSTTDYARFMPGYSKSSPNTDNVLWVTSFRVNNSTKFEGIVKDINNAMVKSEGSPRGYWYSTIGGSKETAHYFVSTPFKDFAGLDVVRDDVWTLYEKVNGKKNSDILRADLRAIVTESWAYMYKRDKELSHIP